MSLSFDSLTALQVEWQALQPLKPEHRDRLWRKFRLEWNYHSNHIEGNTLTYGETELLLLHDRTTGNHSHREYLEMKAHDVGIEHVRNLAADESRILTESDIRDLNKIILKEPFWKPAETADGQATRKQIIPGDYKTTPNNVRTATGEMFYFASVEDTPPRMQALAGWLRGELESPTLHPIVLATKLHHDFVLIHPFDDGNGRVARLLVNYVLLRTGYLPVIVRSEDKANYLTALRLADAGDLTPLTDYLARLAEWSLSLGIKAAKGESVEELSDVEKELAIFIRSQWINQASTVQRSNEAIRNLYELGIKSLLDALDAKMKKVEPLFAKFSIDVHPSAHDGNLSSSESFRRYTNSSRSLERFFVIYDFRGFRGSETDPFDVSATFEFRFEEFQYRLYAEGEISLRKLYSDPLLADEIEEISVRFLAAAFKKIRRLSGQS